MTERIALFLKDAIQRNQRTTWLVIAQRAGAKIFENVGPGNRFQPIYALSFPEGHPFSPPESAHAHLGAVFARKIADVLEKERGRSAYDQLVLIAEPKFLGMLEVSTFKPNAKTILATIGKQLDERQESRLLDRALELLREARAA